MIPTLANFSGRRPLNVVAGQPRYVNTSDLSEYTRSSPLAATSAPVMSGVAVQFTGTVNAQGQHEVTAVDGSLTAANFAGFVLVSHEDSRDRAAIPSLGSDPNVNSNVFSFEPGCYIPRWTFKPIWVRTDLTAPPTVGAPVQVIAGGLVSDAGGTALTGVVFTGEIATGWDGLLYAVVNIVTPIVA